MKAQLARLLISFNIGVILLALPVLAATPIKPPDPPVIYVKPTPIGPYARVMAAAFFPDNNTVALGVNDNNLWTIRLWDLKANKETGVIKPEAYEKNQSNLLQAMSLSADGKTIAAAAGKLYIFDVPSGKIIAQPATKGRYANGAALSPDGKLVAASDSKGTIIYEIATGKTLATLPLGEGHITFSHDGSTLAAHNSLFSTTTWKQTGDFFVNDSVNGLTTSPDGHAYAQSTATTVTLWFAGDRAEKPRWTLYHGGGDLAFTPDGKTLIVSAGHLRLIDVATGIERAFLVSADPAAPYNSGLALSPNGKVAVSCGNNYSPQPAFLWDLTPYATALPASIIPKASIDVRYINVAAISADGKTLAAQSGDAITLYDYPFAQLRSRIVHQEINTRVLALSPDGKVLLAAGPEKGVTLLNTSTGTALRYYDLPKGNFAAARFSADGKNVALAGNKLHLINVLSGVIRPIDLPPCDYPIFAFTADLKQMASRESVKGAADTIHLWQLPDGKDIKTIDLGVVKGRPRPIPTALAYSPDGKLLAISGQRGGQIVDLASGKFIAPMPENGSFVAFSPDSSKLICMTANGMSDTRNFWLIDPKSGKTTPICGTIADFPIGLAWAGNSSFFYYGSDSIHFFDVH